MLAFNKRDPEAISDAGRMLGSGTGGKPQLRCGVRGTAGPLRTAGEGSQEGCPPGPAVALDLRGRAWWLSLGQLASSKGHRCGAVQTRCSMHTVGVSTHPGAPYPPSAWVTVNTCHLRQQQHRNSANSSGVTEGVLAWAGAAPRALYASHILFSRNLYNDTTETRCRHGFGAGLGSDGALCDVLGGVGKPRSARACVTAFWGEEEIGGDVNKQDLLTH